MRVLQLIDSLNPGGAERMAVSYANALQGILEGSYLCATRCGGVLEHQLHPDVPYIIANKTHTLDWRALIRLRRFVKKHQITVIHAHTTSYFFASLLKISYPSLRLIWHEHHGKRGNTGLWQNKMLYLCSFFFHTVLAVSQPLRTWCERNLAVKNVVYIPNFVDTTVRVESCKIRNKTIVCLANLREPKNHLNLLRAFQKVHRTYPEWKLQLIGRIDENAYAEAVIGFIKTHGLEKVVELSGSSAQVHSLLSQAAIGVLASDTEGMPMALLEYGLAELAVVSTKVGACAEVLQTYGKLVPPENSDALASELLFYIAHPEQRRNDARAFSEHICAQYSFTQVKPTVLKSYKN